jgi:hypothetical protein
MSSWMTKCLSAQGTAHTIEVCWDKSFLFPVHVRLGKTREKDMDRTDQRSEQVTPKERIMTMGVL